MCSYFNVTDIKDYCLDFLMENMDVQNCLSILTFSVKYNEKKLEAKSTTFIDEHFDLAVQQEEFNQLNIDDMLAVIGMKDKKVVI